MKRIFEKTAGSCSGPWVFGVLLTLIVGCEGPEEGSESLWVGVIEPTAEEVLKGDDILGSQELENTEPLVTSDSPVKQEEISSTEERPEEESTEISEPVIHPAEQVDTEGEAETVVEAEVASSSDIPSGDSDNEEEEDSEEEEVKPSISEETEELSEESVLDQGEAVVKFVADFSCTSGVHEEHVYVLGMDKWNEEWAIAVHLERVEDSHHYEGSWTGTGGDYTFLMSHGKMDATQANPWDEVEEIEGQSCTADTYGNRGVRAQAGETITVELTFGFCDGCPSTCAGSCGGTSVSGDCFCDSHCEEYGDCCSDFLTLCLPQSCEGHCGGKHDSSNCYCDDSCTSYNDCCGDFQEVCGD